MRLAREVIIPRAPAPIGWPLIAAMAMLAALFAASRFTASDRATEARQTLADYRFSTSVVLSRAKDDATEGPRKADSAPPAEVDFPFPPVRLCRLRSDTRRSGSGQPRAARFDTVECEHEDALLGRRPIPIDADRDYGVMR